MNMYFVVLWVEFTGSVELILLKKQFPIFLIPKLSDFYPSLRGPDTRDKLREAILSHKGIASHLMGARNDSFGSSLNWKSLNLGNI